MSKAQKFKCAECGKMTKLIQRMDKLEDDVEHNYFECQHCKSKVTIYYSDARLREMIEKQQKYRRRGMFTKHKELTTEIENMMKDLKNRFSS